MLRTLSHRVVLSGVFAGLMGVAAAAQPAPQIHAEDVVQTFGGQPDNGAQNGKCDRNSWITAEDGTRVHPKCTSLGFNLGKASEPGHQAPVAAKPGRTNRTQVTRTEAAPPPAADVTMNLLLTFELNSDRLTPQGMANAQEFAKGLQDPRLAGSRFRVEGYTDASGSRAHNLALSKRRADSTKAYLVSLGVDPSRLETKGFGPVLARPDAPTDEANRRVVARRIF